MKLRSCKRTQFNIAKYINSFCAPPRHRHCGRRLLSKAEQADDKLTANNFTAKRSMQARYMKNIQNRQSRITDLTQIICSRITATFRLFYLSRYHPCLSN